MEMVLATEFRFILGEKEGPKGNFRLGGGKNDGGSVQNYPYSTKHGTREEGVVVVNPKSHP